MSININKGETTYGQPPYFDNSTLNFDPIGTQYNYGPLGIQPSGQNKAIQYGSSFGDSRLKLCARRYLFQYQATNNIFVYYKTYQGNRGHGSSSSVNDVAFLNDLIQENILEITNENEPTFLTNDILHSLFSFPSNNDYFFVEGAHFVNRVRRITYEGSDWDNKRMRPNFFKIRRYGKMSSIPFNGEISRVLIYKENFNINF
jgi:hypothetical protein